MSSIICFEINVFSNIHFSDIRRVVFLEKGVIGHLIVFHVIINYSHLRSKCSLIWLVIKGISVPNLFIGVTYMIFWFCVIDDTFRINTMLLLDGMSYTFLIKVTIWVYLHLGNGVWGKRTQLEIKGPFYPEKS